MRVRPGERDRRRESKLEPLFELSNGFCTLMLDRSKSSTNFIDSTKLDGSSQLRAACQSVQSENLPCRIAHLTLTGKVSGGSETESESESEAPLSVWPLSVLQQLTTQSANIGIVSLTIMFSYAQLRQIFAQFQSCNVELLYWKSESCIGRHKSS